MKATTFIKWLCPALLLSGGVVMNAEMQSAVESFLPSVNTITLEKSEYMQTVSGSGYIYRLDDLDKWCVRVQVNECDIRNVSVGQTAALSGAAFEDGVYKAEISAVAETAKQVTSRGFLETVVDVTLEITNPDSGLRSGYTASAEIEVGEPREIYLLPYDVICQDDDGEYVYVLRANTAIRRNISTGEEFPEGAELLGGLSETDEIITAPQNIEKNNNGSNPLLVKKEDGN